ncbi:MAG TPA: heme o synthase [Candidatus Saccharimonadales bacterium]|nr:heme o synthase [Candidatus Saccharimonadales bacterium]
MVKAYYQLTKPGIIYGNLLTAVGGFLLASQGRIDFVLFVAVLAGTAFVIGSACAINNYIDRDIDAKMARTKKRALVHGDISGRSALVFAAILGALGFGTLALMTNHITLLVGVIGFVDYLVFYSISKRRSTLGTIIGSIAGATPVVAGYTAVGGSLDIGALLLFLILACWQMPHFYAIAIFRQTDYKAAGLPVLPVVKGVAQAKRHIVGYILLFLTAIGLLWSFGYAGTVYVVVMMLFGFGWLLLGMHGFTARDNTLWARQMFKFSLVVILAFSTTLSLNAWLL